MVDDLENTKILYKLNIIEKITQIVLHAYFKHIIKNGISQLCFILVYIGILYSYAKVQKCIEILTMNICVLN